MILVKVLYWIFNILFKKGEVCVIEGKNSAAYGNIPLITEGLLEQKIRYTIISHDSFFVKAVFKIAKAKVIIIDQSNKYLSNIKLSKQTRVLQIWHGGGILKRVGYDKQRHKTQKEINRLHRVYGNITDAIVCDAKLKEYYASAFNLKVESIHATGIPRTDLLFKINNIDVINLKKRYGLADKKIVLVALSYLEVKRKRIRRDINLESIQQSLGKKYFVVERLHPTLELHCDSPLKSLSAYQILSMADILVTDTSSILFDYSFFNRPILFFKMQEISRDDLYINPTELGYITSNESDLVAKIKEDPPPKRVWNNFMNNCQGNSTKNVINLINEMAK